MVTIAARIFRESRILRTTERLRNAEHAGTTADALMAGDAVEGNQDRARWGKLVL
jgi:hypothetical protein